MALAIEFDYFESLPCNFPRIPTLIFILNSFSYDGMKTKKNSNEIEKEFFF